MRRGSRSATRRWRASISRATSSTRSGTTPSLHARHNTPHVALNCACVLSGAGQERGGNIPERPQAVGWLSRVPIVVARERDVLPAERRDVGEQFVGDNDALGA